MCEYFFKKGSGEIIGAFVLYVSLNWYRVYVTIKRPRSLTTPQKLPSSLVRDEEGRILHYTTTPNAAPTNYITAAPYFASTAYFTDPPK